jgi:hypothetical protein
MILKSPVTNDVSEPVIARLLCSTTTCVSFIAKHV